MIELANFDEKNKNYLDRSTFFSSSILSRMDVVINDLDR